MDPTFNLNKHFSRSEQTRTRLSGAMRPSYLPQEECEFSTSRSTHTTNDNYLSQQLNCFPLTSHGQVFSNANRAPIYSSIGYMENYASNPYQNPAVSRSDHSASRALATAMLDDDIPPQSDCIMPVLPYDWALPYAGPQFHSSSRTKAGGSLYDFSHYRIGGRASNDFQPSESFATTRNDTASRFSQVSHHPTHNDTSGAAEPRTAPNTKQPRKSRKKQASSTVNQDRDSKPHRAGSDKIVPVGSDDRQVVAVPKRRKRKGSVPLQDRPSIRMANGQLSNSEYKMNSGIREPVPLPKASGLFFNDLTDAQQSVGKPSWMPPANDHSLPKTATEVQDWVLRLRGAMEDMSQTRENPSSTLKKRWLPEGWIAGMSYGSTVTNGYYPLHWMEAKCWEIVYMCIRLHQHGPGIIRCLDPFVLERSFNTKHLTFKERMYHMINMARKCKNRISEVLGGGVIEEYVLTPAHLVDQSTTNQGNNGNRQVWLHYGRENAPVVEDQTGSEAVIEADNHTAPSLDKSCNPKFIAPDATTNANLDDHDTPAMVEPQDPEYGSNLFKLVDENAVDAGEQQDVNARPDFPNFVGATGRADYAHQDFETGLDNADFINDTAATSDKQQYVDAGRRHTGIALEDSLVATESDNGYIAAQAASNRPTPLETWELDMMTYGTGMNSSDNQKLSNPQYAAEVSPPYVPQDVPQYGELRRQRYQSGPVKYDTAPSEEPSQPPRPQVASPSADNNGKRKRSTATEERVKRSRLS